MQQKIDRLINAYRCGSLNEEEAGMLAKWLDESEDHRAYFRTRLARSAVSASMKAEQEWRRFAVHNKILFNLSGSKPARPQKRIWAYALIAVVVLAGVCAFGFWPYSSIRIKTSEKREIMANRPLKYKTTSGEKLDLVLPDGSKVYMNSEALLIVDPDFGEKTREIQFDGEAFFSISPNKECPFIIHCGSDNYTVLGTSFNLQTYAREKYSVVTLHTGCLQAQIKEDVIILGPNEELQVDASTNTITKREARVNDSIGWIDGRLIFSENPLKDVANKLSRHYQVRINVHEEIANLKYTGMVDRETLQEALQMISEASPVRLSITNIDGEYFLSRSKRR